jgi:integrase
MFHTQRSVSPTKILTRTELATVLADLKRKSLRSKRSAQNLNLFRLATCCGLRASEIARLQIGDVRVESARPHLRIRRGAAKGGKSRVVPLWWDAGTLADLTTAGIRSSRMHWRVAAHWRRFVMPRDMPT